MRSLAALLLPTLLAAQTPPVRYALADLQALAKESAWLELSQHLGDILPSQRTAAWQSLLKQTANGLLATDIQAERSLDGLWRAEDFVKQYPQLKRDEPFMAKRAQVGLQYFERCFQQSWGGGEYCLEGLNSFQAADPTNLDLAFRTAKIVRLQMSHWSAIRFFRAALAPPAASRPCTDEDVWLSLVSALSLPESYTKPLADAKQVAGTACWAELKTKLVEEFKENNSYYKRNLCSIAAGKPELAAPCK
jgi:hypothetical protein